MRLLNSILLVTTFASTSAFAEEATNTHSNTVSMLPITFQNQQLIEPAIISDCDLLTVQRNEVNKFASKLGLVINNAPDEASATGRVLQIQIANAVASGNAFVGHNKQVTLIGKLLENGQEVASFSALRSSGGGAFAGFKNSCSVLHRCATTLGKDVSEWLRNPTPNARLGELK